MVWPVGCLKTHTDTAVGAVSCCFGEGNSGNYRGVKIGDMGEGGYLGGSYNWEGGWAKWSWVFAFIIAGQ